jgi:hypothetical protein
MIEVPELTYDSANQVVYVEHEDIKEELYSGVNPAEFDVISDIDTLLNEAASLFDRIFGVVGGIKKLVRDGEYFSRLNALQQEASQYFAENQRLQSRADRSDSDVVQAQLGQLYKLEKFLKHFLRQLSVAQSLGFSERQLLAYLQTGDHVFLYGFVRNACSTLEYLGKLYEGRRGEGKIGRKDKSVTFKQVYSELKDQGLTKTYGDDQTAIIPGADERREMSEMGLNADQIEFLWKKRNEIVHHCPLVIEDETAKNLPDELLSTEMLREAEIEKLTALSVRVHLHSIGIFLKFSSSYLHDLIEQVVESWYYQRN